MGEIEKIIPISAPRIRGSPCFQLSLSLSLPLLVSFRTLSRNGAAPFVLVAAAIVSIGQLRGRGFLRVTRVHTCALLEGFFGTGRFFCEADRCSRSGRRRYRRRCARPNKHRHCSAAHAFSSARTRDGKKGRCRRCQRLFQCRSADANSDEAGGADALIALDQDEDDGQDADADDMPRDREQFLQLETR